MKQFIKAERAGGIYAVGRLVRQHRKLTKDNIS